jgi:hypothetical protein
VTDAQTNTVELDAGLAQRARREAAARGISLKQFVANTLERELTNRSPQPPFSMIGAFRSGRGDLSKLASEDIFEPEPFR